MTGVGEAPESRSGEGRVSEFGWWLLWIFFQVTGLETRPFQLTVERLEMALEGANSEVWGSN